MAGLMGSGGLGHKLTIVNTTYYGSGTANIANYAFEFKYIENGKLIEKITRTLSIYPEFDFHGVRVRYDKNFSSSTSGLARFIAINDCVLLNPGSDKIINAGAEISISLYTGYNSFCIKLK